MTTALLTTIQAAQYLALTARTLKVWRRLKKGPPFVSLGHRSVRYDSEALRTWAQQKVTSPEAVTQGDQA